MNASTPYCSDTAGMGGERDTWPEILARSYGFDVHDLSRAGQVFTVLLLIGGVGAALYTFTLLATVVASSFFSPFLGAAVSLAIVAVAAMVAPRVRRARARDRPGCCA